MLEPNMARRIYGFSVDQVISNAKSTVYKLHPPPETRTAEAALAATGVVLGDVCKIVLCTWEGITDSLFLSECRRIEHPIPNPDASV